MLDIVCRTALAGGEAIIEVYAEEFDVRQKLDKTPVTEADLAGERVLDGAACRVLRHLDRVRGTGSMPREYRLAADRFWAVDPLDGTREFIAQERRVRGLIGLVEEGRPVLGVLHGPAIGLTYAAYGPGTAPASAVASPSSRSALASHPRKGSSSFTAGHTRTAGASPNSSKVIRFWSAANVAAPSNSG